MDKRSIFATSFPLAQPADAQWTDTVVTEGHVAYCAEHGHATLTTDGVSAPFCPRCGADISEPAPCAHPSESRRGSVIYPDGDPARPVTAIWCHACGDEIERVEGDRMPATNAATIADECDVAVVSPAPEPCTHWECALLGETCALTGSPAMTPPRKPRQYNATRIVARFYEYVNADGTPDIQGSDETFNVDATPHETASEALTFDSVAELVSAVRRDYVTFESTGDTWAGDPDGSQIIDYATAEREAVSWHFDGISPALMARVIIPAVDAQ